MVLDTSAVLALLLGEKDAQALAVVFAEESKRIISAGTLLELMIVIEAKKGEAGARELDLLLHRAKVDVIAFDGEQVEIARNAWREFGKGNHPASLNFGDCFAYALSKISGEPLLFKGNGFDKTDLNLIKYSI